ncbi:MAG: hypothetical protein PHX82_15535 [Paracoccaceae bacterium]|nr:hypothetical protein [Paracoccaceae bacterium]
MPSLKDFVAALQAGWFPALAALVGCAIVIAGDWYQVPYLSSTPPFLLTAAVIVGVFAFSILAANIVYAPIAVWRSIKRARARKNFKERIEAEVFSSPPEEMAILAYLVTTGRKAFAAEFNDRRLAPLVAKGIVVKLGGTHSVLEWPYMVQEDVWQLLLMRKDELRVPNAANMPDIFHWRSGW